MTARTIPLARPLLGSTLPFALPIGLSAFLLFSVEPLIGRLVLPVFGGTPAVWATVLFFFQGVLLVGYLYGHVSVTRLGALGPPLHLILAGLAVVALLVAPSRVADLRAEAIPPVLDLIRILLVLVGLPALVLTTTTPLVSGLVRGLAIARDRRRRLLAVRAQQRRLAARPARLPVPHRAAARPDDAARGLGGRLWAAGRAARRRRVPRVAGAARSRRRRRRRGAHDRRRPDGRRRARDHRRDIGRLAPSRPLVAARRGPVRAAVGRHDVHRRGSRLGAAALGRAARDLPRLVHRRVLAAWRSLDRLPRSRSPRRW